MFACIRKAIAVILSFFVFSPVTVAPWYSFSKEAEMTAVVFSDTHFEGNSQTHFKNNGLGFANAFASDRKPDVVGFLGDQTMNGQDIEWLFFYGFLSRYGVLDRTVMAFGNHDFGNTADNAQYEKLSKRSISYYNDFCGKKIKNVYYSEEFNGYKFIVLGSDKNMENTVSHIGGEELKWFRNELASANGKPVFVLNHNLIYDTNGARSKYSFNQIDGGEEIKAAMEEYNGKVFYLCGHSHFGVNSGSVRTIRNVTYFNLPSFGNDGNYDAGGELGESSGIGLRIEAFGDRVTFAFVNFAANKPVEGFDSIVVNY